MKKKIKYITPHRDCEKRECFVPFTGNGMPICRRHELGQCPPDKGEKKNDKRRD